MLSYAYLYLDQLDDAQKTLQRASDRKLNMAQFLVPRYSIAFNRGDPTGTQRVAEMADKQFGTDAPIVATEAFALAYSGRLQEANRVYQRAVDMALQADQRESSILFQTGAALWQAFFGGLPAAERGARAALRLSKQRDVEYGAAFALALCRESSDSKTIAKDLEKRFSEDTSVKFSYLPGLRALAELNQGNPLQAVEVLQTATPYDFGAPRSSFHGFFGPPYTVVCARLGVSGGTRRTPGRG